MTAQSIDAGSGGEYGRYLEGKTRAPERGSYYLTPEGEPQQAPGRCLGTTVGRAGRGRPLAQTKEIEAARQPYNRAIGAHAVPGQHAVERAERRLRYLVWQVRRELRDLLLRKGMTDSKTAREDLALRFLRGDGIEIGALDYPLRLPRGVSSIRYVDYADAETLRAVHATATGNIVAPDVIDDGERLSSFKDRSVDFVVANHMLEHVEDPIEALTNQLRVLKAGGILFLAIPDGNHSFDRARPKTSVEHLIRDHENGAHASRRQHYEECARWIEGHQGAGIAQRADEMEGEELRPHFHVWDALTFGAFLASVELPARLEALQTTGDEFVAVLRKT